MTSVLSKLPHNLIKEVLTEFIEQFFNREGSLYLASNEKRAFCTCQKDCDALYYLLDSIFIKFGSTLYRQIVGTPMGTNCSLLL